MFDMIRRLEFWIAMAVVVAIKFTTPHKLSPARRVVTVLIAVGSAVSFTEPVLAWLSLDPATYEIGVAALVALTAEHLARQLLGASLADLLGLVKGGRQ